MPSTPAAIDKARSKSARHFRGRHSPARIRDERDLPTPLDRLFHALELLAELGRENR